MATNLSVSKRYEKETFLYWWDVWDTRKEAIRRSGQLVLVQRDTGLRAKIPAAELLPLLTEGRRTSRGRNMGGRGNWGLYLRQRHPNQIEIPGGRKAPATIVVVWKESQSSH